MYASHRVYFGESWNETWKVLVHSTHCGRALCVHLTTDSCRLRLTAGLLLNIATEQCTLPYRKKQFEANCSWRPPTLVYPGSGFQSDLVYICHIVFFRLRLYLLIMGDNPLFNLWLSCRCYSINGWEISQFRARQASLLHLHPGVMLSYQFPDPPYTADAIICIYLIIDKSVSTYTMSRSICNNKCHRWVWSHLETLSHSITVNTL